MVENTLWYNVSCGWISATDSTGAVNAFFSNETEAFKAWTLEFNNRRRVSSAISSLLIRSYSLTRARKVAKAMMNYCENPNRSALVNLAIKPIETILVLIQSIYSPKQTQIYEFLKIIASQQSNPITALIDMSKEIYTTIIQRPTIWVTEDLKVLETEQIKNRNNIFITAACKGNYNLVKQYLDEGQDLLAVHSDLKYTALHAAADFGNYDILKLLINSGNLFYFKLIVDFF